MNIAPVSSLTDGILPLIRLEKNESEIHVRVCWEVANLYNYIIIIES
jgi:hypothetical protein